MQTPESPSTELLLADVDSAIRSAVRQKLRVTLRVDDYRERNLDALDVLQDIRLKLIRRLSQPDPAGEASSIQEFIAYASTVAYHTCWDYLRAKYPKRTSLKNSLRRVLDKAGEYDTWEGQDGELLCGFAGWKHLAFPIPSARIRELRLEPHRLPRKTVPRLEDMGWEQWKGLLDDVFEHLDGPLPLDDLIAIVAPLVGMEDLPDAGRLPADGEEEPGVDWLASGEPSPYSVWLTSERLKLFWTAVHKLLIWHRVAYLLNFRDGDLEALPMYGIATVEQIGEALELTGKQYGILARTFPAAAAQGRSLTGGTRGSRFVPFWKYLPLEDNSIASLLEVTRAQVIAYRSKARERLRRMLEGTR